VLGVTFVGPSFTMRGMTTRIPFLFLFLTVFLVGSLTAPAQIATDDPPAKGEGKAKASAKTEPAGKATDEAKAKPKGASEGKKREAKAKKAPVKKGAAAKEEPEMKGKEAGKAKAKPEAAKKAEPVKAETKPMPKAVAAKGPMTAVLKLKKKPEVKGAGEGGNVLGVFEYEVVEVLDGVAPGKTIRVAHGVIWDGKVTDANKRAAGSTRTLELVPLSHYPGLKKTKVVGGSADGLYIPKL
jgi:hypothetical protein